jgi:hypothetical protein
MTFYVFILTLKPWQDQQDGADQNDPCAMVITHVIGFGHLSLFVMAFLL